MPFMSNFIQPTKMLDVCEDFAKGYIKVHTCNGSKSIIYLIVYKNCIKLWLLRTVYNYYVCNKASGQAKKPDFECIKHDITTNNV